MGFQPFYNPNSQKGLAEKVLKSNKRHRYWERKNK